MKSTDLKILLIVMIEFYSYLGDDCRMLQGNFLCFPEEEALITLSQMGSLRMSQVILADLTSFFNGVIGLA